MPATNGIGQSAQTVKKQEGLLAILKQHLNTCKAIMAQGWSHQVYHYIDTNAGSGYNLEQQCNGSPIIFLKTAARFNIAYKASFIEIDPLHTFMLRIRSANWNNWEVYTDDNQIVLPDLIREIPPKAYGMIYMDPNGIPDFNLLAEISKLPQMRFIDIVVRYCASAVKRNEYQHRKKLLDYMDGVSKKHWIVRKIEKGDSWHWSFLIGMNWDRWNVWKSQGFHYAYSDEGKTILDRLNYNNDELQALYQPSFFLNDEIPYDSYAEYLQHPQYKKVRQMAIDRACGICEHCENYPVTQVHHIEYPKWGTFEKNADKLLALCHRCHCLIHGKEN